MTTNRIKAAGACAVPTLAAFAASACFAAAAAFAAAPVQTDPEAGFAHATADLQLRFPRDYGSHPDFRTEWWYVTGWLETDAGETLGFQATFFRSRPSAADANPSAFAPRQLLIGHCAISDPAQGRLWLDQRIRRGGMGLAGAQQGDTRVWIDDWELSRGATGYQLGVAASDFALRLQLQATQPPMLNGVEGLSRKGPSPLSASAYYSEPQLRVSGRIGRRHVDSGVHGEAWLDHEWSSDYLEPDATGWDWVGINLRDGGALMAFRIRNAQGQALWTGATLRESSGHVRTYGGGDVAFTAGRRWRSGRTGVSYPVAWRLRVGTRVFDVVPLMDDQENDARASSGVLYWEGAVQLEQQDRSVGRGYLELTGYDAPLRLR